MPYIPSMSSITVRNIPENVKAVLARRAEETGESLEAYLRRILEMESSKDPAPDQARLRFRAILKKIEELPPLEPGQKDAWELSEEFSRNDTPAVP